MLSLPSQARRSFSILWVTTLVFLSGAHQCEALIIPNLQYSQPQHEKQSPMSRWDSSIGPHSEMRILSTGRSSSSLCAISDDDSTADDEEENEQDGSTDSDDNIAFFREYQKAKLDKLGLDIPPEQLKASAMSAEQEFLQAMNQCQSDFEEAQEDQATDEGGMSAADFFLDQIKKEEALEELWSKQSEDAVEEGEKAEPKDETSEEDYFQ